MAKHPNSIKNPLPNGKETHSKNYYMEVFVDEAAVTIIVMN